MEDTKYRTRRGAVRATRGPARVAQGLVLSSWFLVLGSPNTATCGGWTTVAVPRTSSTFGGYVSVSIVSATFAFCPSALTFGALGIIPIMNRAPSQWNQIGITRG